MTSFLRRVLSSKAGVTGAVVGVAAAGIAAGVAAERYLVHRSRRGEDPHAEEPFGALPASETLTVPAPDGVDLHVEVVHTAGAPDEDLTIVFVHGFCLDMGTFHFQRKVFGDRYRMVFYDQPGHGKSGRLARGDYTLERLGEALSGVLDRAAPTGPIILVGHSMGGMTIMALAEHRPELFGERVVGVAFLSTSAGAMAQVGLGMPQVFTRFRGPLLPVVRTAAPVTAAVVDRARQATTDLAWLLTKRYGFGGQQPSPSLVSYVERMNSATSLDVIARYLKTINVHDRLAVLAALRRIPVLVLCGDRDLITPLEHSREIARALPDARLVVVADGGHVALLEHAEIVNEALEAFFAEAVSR